MAIAAKALNRRNLGWSKPALDVVVVDVLALANDRDEVATIAGNRFQGLRELLGFRNFGMPIALGSLAMEKCQ